MKTTNILLTTIVSIFALYGVIILTRKIMLSDDEERKTKKELGSKFYIEPYAESAEQKFCNKVCPQLNCSDPGQARGCWLYN